MAVDPSASPAAAAGVPAAAAAALSPASLKQARPEDEIRAVARNFSDQPLPSTDPGVWGVLTAISKNARQRTAGMNILLDKEMHSLGRCVEDARFRIASPAISAFHCNIFVERPPSNGGDGGPDTNSAIPVFLKDTSTNGTYLNWDKLKRNSPKAIIKNGDIISLAGAPHDDNCYAFVYREAARLENGVALKRKSDDMLSESKRQKGIGIGAPDGPILLDDVRSLQRSNTELRQQLESHVLTIETLKGEKRACLSLHEKELKELKESVTGSYVEQIQEFQTALDLKNKEIEERNASSAELRHSIEDLNERLRASVQSRNDACEIINSQKTSIAELELQLDEERNQRREEREKAADDLKFAVQRAHLEAEEETKRQAEVFLRQHREQQEVINKLQDSEKESRYLVETLRSKVEDARESLVVSEKKVRHLEVQIQDEQTVSAASRKKAENLESQLERLKRELEDEKVAREQAWSKVSALELKIASAIRDLSIEKQRFQGARERIILRETQLRAFYSTTEEISSLFTKQQEQLKAMQRTLEDEENYGDSASLGLDLNETMPEIPATSRGHARESVFLANGRRKEGLDASTPKNSQANSRSSGNSDDDASITEKHEMRTQEDDTQDLECTSVRRSDESATGGMVIAAGNPADTERILETESPAGDIRSDEERADLNNKCGNLGGETMQLDEETQVQESSDPAAAGKLGDNGKAHDTPPRSVGDHDIRTADLLASEAVGSWAVSTAPSVHGENESPRSGAAGMNGDCSQANEEDESMSNAETDCGDTDDGDGGGDETAAVSPSGGDDGRASLDDEGEEEVNMVMIEDSVG